MPFYTYQCATVECCDKCRDGFDVLQKLNAQTITLCPECNNKVKRVISAPNVVCGHAHLMKPANVEKTGFTQYKRAGGGVYEKTAGKGPKYISGD